jgi:hypothetical protein
MRQVDDRQQIRRFAARALAGGLSLAALVAIAALLTGDLSDTDGKVILTSIGFALCSATGSSGAAARLRGLELLGGVTLVASVAAFVLLVAGLWTGDWGSEGIWRSFGCAGVVGLAGSHACVMLGARRRDDSEAVTRITAAALWLGAIDGFGAILPISGLVSDVDEVWGRVFGAALVLLVLASVLPPILRRAQPASVPASRNGGPDSLTAHVLEIADRIDVLNSDPGNRAPEIRAEVDRLRKLAQSFEN